MVLGWLNSQSCRLKTYVANRVEHILEITYAHQWKHVQTKENPADLLSRGISAKDLRSNNLWWNGSQWLTSESVAWKESVYEVSEQELPETKAVRLALVSIEPLKDLLQHYSNWTKLIRATAWMSRFKMYLVSREKMPKSKYRTAVELRNAEAMLLKRMQRDEFNKEIVALENGD